MRTIRRLYLYAVAFISVETVLWGIINLTRTIFDRDRVSGSVSQLASALSLLLVGIPVFLLHWWLIQRSIPADQEENSAGLRAVFLYGILLATLVPVTQNVLAGVLRGLALALRIAPESIALGGAQSWLDNAIAAGMNALLALYFASITRANWRTNPQGEAFPLVRRLYRYSWVIYGLVVAVAGVQGVTQYVLSGLATPNLVAGSALVMGLGLTIVGIPLWVEAWRKVQASLAEPGETGSTIRLVLLYLFSLIGVSTVLVAVGESFAATLRGLLGAGLGGWLTEVSGPLSAAFPLGAVWAYYSRVLAAEREALPDLPRRAGLKRLYFYILAALGLAATFVALEILAGFLIETVLGGETLGRETLRNQLSAGLAALFVGLPLWLRTWGPMAREAAAPLEAGDHARRSVVRKGYLYLALFVGVVGVMASAGGLFFQLLRIVLGDPPADPLLVVIQLVKTLLFFSLFLVYHGQALRADSGRSDQALAAQHAQFPVLVLDGGEGAFADEMLAAIQATVPGVPIAVHLAGQGVPSETLTDAKAVVLPASLASNPPEAMRLWLQAFTGLRVVVPSAMEGWLWLDDAGKPGKNQGRQVAQVVRQLAEGQAVEPGSKAPPWLIGLGILGGLVVLMMVLSLLGSLMQF